MPITKALHDDEPPAPAWGGTAVGGWNAGEGNDPDAEADLGAEANETGLEAHFDAPSVEDTDDACGLAPTLDAAALAALIGRVVNQDQAALAALYDALSGRVYASALRITRQVGLAEEVLQDTFWQVWRQAPRFEPGRGSALAWVMNMARSRALDALRSARRDLATGPQASAPAELEDEPTDPSVDPLSLLAGARRDSRLAQVVAGLDPLKRQLIALAYYRGLTQDEIATQTGLPLGTVKSHLRRTLAALRQALGEAEGGEWGRA